ncbi:ABC transporter permease [Candidatus Thorarchaeota archaeon]|nr:MAG: ABC transporter permease [Candidatus Thorarchaeota archaeon]
MGGGRFLVFLRDRLRDRPGYLLTTLIVFSLSAGVLGGVLVYLDSAQPTIWSDATAGMSAHIEMGFTYQFYDQNTTSEAEIVDLIGSQDYVTDAVAFSMVEAHLSFVLEPQLKHIVYLGAGEDFLDAFLRDARLSEDSIPLTENGCYIESTLFERYNLSVGDSWAFRISKASFETFSTTLQICGTFEGLSRWGSYSGPEGTEYPVLRMIASEETLRARFSDNFPIHREIWIRIDSEAILQENTYSVSTLQTLKARIDQGAFPYASVEEYPLLEVAVSYSSWLSSIRAVSIAFSIPSLIMAFMLIQYNHELLADQRRREVGTITTRGSSNAQAFTWIVSYSVVVGFIGSLGAILTGLFAALLSGSTESLLIFDLTSLQGFSIILTPSSILLIFGFSFVSGLAVSLPSAVQYLLMPATEAHSAWEGGELVSRERMGSWSVDVVLVSLSGVASLPFLRALGAGELGSSVLLKLVIVLVLGTFVIFSARLGARPAGRIKNEILSRIQLSSVRVGTNIMGRISQLSSKREAMGVLFGSIVITAGLFSVISSATGDGHLKDLAMFEVGSNVAVYCDGGNVEISGEQLDQMRRIAGISEVSPVLHYVSRIQFLFVGPYHSERYNVSFDIIGVDPSSFLRVSEILPYFVLSGNPYASFNRLDDDSSAVISSFRPIIGYKLQGESYVPIYGSDIQAQLATDDGHQAVNVTIIDVLSKDEALDSDGYMPGFTSKKEFLVFNIKALQERLNASYVTSVSLSLDGTRSVTEIIEDLEDFMPGVFAGYSSADEMLAEIHSSMMARTIYGVHNLNVIFSLIYVVIGVSITSTEKSKRLRGHFAVLRAMGTEERSLMTGLMADNLIGLALSSIIGAVTAAVLSLFILGSPVVYMGTLSKVPWDTLPVRLILPVGFTVLFLGAGILLPLVTVYLVSRTLLKRTIAEDLPTVD